jgi:hypothetical protein
MGQFTGQYCNPPAVRLQGEPELPAANGYLNMIAISKQSNQRRWSLTDNRRDRHGQPGWKITA